MVQLQPLIYIGVLPAARMLYKAAIFRKLILLFFAIVQAVAPLQA